jgi:histidyl-tRNA synthetase
MGRPKKAQPSISKAPNKIKGTFDLVPEQHHEIHDLYEDFFRLAHNFGYLRLDTPLIEDARLYKLWRETGKSLFEFESEDLGRAAFKPNNLFSLARAFLEYRYFERERISKWYFSSKVMHMSSDELAQSDEFGITVFGEIAPISDAQVINLALRFFNEIGLKDVSVDINNVGCLNCQPVYAEVLRGYLKERKYDLCEKCLELADDEPMQVLNCANLSCGTAASEAPCMVDYLCEPCRRHFIAVLEGLDELGIPYNLSQRVVGPHWCRRTVFECRVKVDQQEVPVCFGGHADDLIQSLGGQQASCLYFTATLQNVLFALNSLQVKRLPRQKVDVYLVPLGDLAAKKTLKLFSELWSNNIPASEFIGPGSIKTQLKLAEINKVSIALIIGQKEAREGSVILRDVRSGMQELFNMDRIIEEVKKRLGR